MDLIDEAGFISGLQWSVEQAMD